MSEIRTTSSTGGQKGVKPERFSLMPKKGLEAVARVFGFGAEKYAAHNWRRGYEWSKNFDALERHSQAAKDGETYDLCDDSCPHLSETGDRTCRNHSGLPHLAHAGFHILVLLTWLEDQGEGADNPFDDRWPAAMERMRRAEEAATLEAAEGWEDVGHTSWEDIGHISLDGAEKLEEFGPDLLPKRFFLDRSISDPKTATHQG